MSRNDNDTGRRARDLGNDTGLVVAMSIAGDLDGRVARSDGHDSVVDPGRTLGGVASTVVAVVDVGQAVRPAGQVGLSSEGDQGVGLGLVGGSGRDSKGAEGALLGVRQVVEMESLQFLQIIT